MRLIFRFFTGVVVIVFLLALGSLLLPKEVEVSRSIIIEAEPVEIFPHVNSMQATQAWSPWLERDPNVKLEYQGPDAGVGSKLIWASDVRDVGSGTQEITLSVENQKVETALDFGPMGTANAAFTLAATADGTELTWGFVTDLGYNPMARYMGLMMDRMLGPDYEQGLNNIKALVEG